MEELANRVDILSGAYVQPDQPFLTEAETEQAVATLSKPIYSQVLRAKNDPRISGQEIALFSFTPSRNAKPDSYGIYGVAKIRGVYLTPKLASRAAEVIIREVDSVNEIYHTRVGEAFPLTKESKWTEKFDAIEVRKQMDDIEREKRQNMEEQDEQERKSMLNREKQLLDENKQILDGTYQEEPLDTYIRLNVARAQLKWTRNDLKRRLEKEVEPAIQRRDEEIKAMDIKHPTFRDAFLQKYMEARSAACLSNEIPADHESVQQGFLKYLCEDQCSHSAEND